MVAAIVGVEDDSLGGQLRVGDVEEIAIVEPLEESAARLFDSFANHHDPVPPFALRRLVRKLRDFLSQETKILITPLGDDLFFDLLRFPAAFARAMGSLRPLERIPGIFRQIIRDRDEIGHRIDAKDKVNPFVRPAVQFLG
ncbi:MAG: hypothetical protein KF895_16135, partial [Parvibaculum sp.]|nr:hypothetical protein [Parvibaculum sp.]